MVRPKPHYVRVTTTTADLLSALAGWTITRAKLPGDILGWTCWSTRTITLDPRIGPHAARSTLAHELSHIKRGMPPDDPVLLAYEEEACEQEAARRLIPLPKLLRALRTCNHRRCVAEILHVDRSMLEARLRGLHPTEWRQVQAIRGDLELAV